MVLGWGCVPMERKRVVKIARRAVKAGVVPTFRVDLSRREVLELPGLFFDGTGPPAIAEAARRTIAAEIGVRADQIEVEAVNDAGRADGDQKETTMSDEPAKRYLNPDEIRAAAGERADGRPTESPEELTSKHDQMPTVTPEERGQQPTTEHGPGGDL